jgi:DinB superfamily
LRSADARVLSERPVSGKWSIIENVRHLLFAEQLHLGRFLPDGAAWRLTQRGKAFVIKGGVVVFRRDGHQMLAEFDGAAPTEDLEEVLRAWDLIHRPIRKAVKATGGDAHYELERNLKHLRRHVWVIERLVARAGKDS